MRLATLCFLTRRGRILLMRKKCGIGAGKYTGPGGKIEPGESPRGAAAREVLEEVCVKVLPEDLELMGVCKFHFGRKHFMEVFVFKGTKFSGKPSETEEADPRWFPLRDIPYTEMWEDGRYWLPLLLAGKRFGGTFKFDPSRERLVSHRLRILPSSPSGGRRNP